MKILINKTTAETVTRNAVFPSWKNEALGEGLLIASTDKNKRRNLRTENSEGTPRGLGNQSQIDRMAGVRLEVSKLPRFRSRIMLKTTARQILENDYVTCRSPQTINDTIKFLLNSGKTEFQLQFPNLNQLAHEEFNEASISTTKISDQPENQADGGRIAKLQGLLPIEHLKPEEKPSLSTIYDQYLDLFFLKWDKITTTTVVVHEIRTPNAV
ncbi:Hypothetical protein CINCED_3A018669 [Cinara cedri]|uniref:Uncharacterized protein n=1 Tax=Cinara cedri TaxID=506608 RepID=A0A5E4MHC7_9HEMI|nr:Hypothetical protein CINCED_3A018669 [Cinara cedri]